MGSGCIMYVKTVYTNGGLNSDFKIVS